MGFAAHATKLLEDLKLGYTAAVAATRVQESWLVLSWDQTNHTYIDAEMIYIGDPQSTLACVYHPPSEMGPNLDLPNVYRTFEGPYSSWFAIFPKEVPAQ